MATHEKSPKRRSIRFLDDNDKAEADLVNTAMERKILGETDTCLRAPLPTDKLDGRYGKWNVGKNVYVENRFEHSLPLSGTNHSSSTFDLDTPYTYVLVLRKTPLWDYGSGLVHRKIITWHKIILAELTDAGFDCVLVSVPPHPPIFHAHPYPCTSSIYPPSNLHDTHDNTRMHTRICAPCLHSRPNIQSVRATRALRSA